MEIVNFQGKKLMLLAEEVGVHIGDGSMNFYKNKRKLKGLYQLRGHLIDDREYYFEHLQKLYYKLFKIKVSIRDMKSTGVLGFQIWNDQLVNFKKQLGLPLGWKENIVIPQLFLKDNKLKSNVLRGIFDTDGCIYLEKKKKLYPRVEIRTTSPPLARQIMTILKDLHIHATSYGIKRENKNWKDLVCISVRGYEATRRFFRIIKPYNPKHNIKFGKLF